MKHLRLVLGLLFAVNGLAMLIAPGHWYGAVPGVMDSGPFNAHFIRDIGAVYALGGLAFMALAVTAAARDYARAASAFLLAHGAIHVFEVAAGVHAVEHLVTDAPGVLLLPLLAAWAASRRTTFPPQGERP